MNTLRRWVSLPGTRDRLLLIAACAVILFAPGGSTTLWNRHEGRFVASACDMLRTGQWAIPRNDGQPLVFYPPLMMWLIALSAKLLGGLTEFAARFPAAAGSLGCILIAYDFGSRMFDRRTGLFGALALLAIPVWQRYSCACQPDSLMTFFLMLGLWAFWRARLEEAPRWCWTFLLGFAIGAAVLPKGPAGAALVVLVLGTFLALELWPGLRREGGSLASAIAVAVRDTVAGFFSRSGPAGTVWKLRPPVVIAIALAVSVPWFVVAWKIAGPGYVNAMWHETADMAAGGPMSMHKAPFFYYVPRLLGTSFPWSIFFVAALLPVASAAASPEERSAKRFLVSWFASLLLLFSVSKGKRAYYMVPFYPPVAILAATWWTRPPAFPRAALARFRQRAPWIVFMLVAVAGVVVVPFLSQDRLERLHVGMELIPVAAAGVLFVAVVTWLHVKKGPSTSFGLLAGTLLLIIGAQLNVGQRWEDMEGRQAVAFCDRVKSKVPPGDVLVLQGVVPQAAFYLDRDVRYGNASEILALAAQQGRTLWLLVGEEEWNRNEGEEQLRFEIVDNPGFQVDNLLLCRSKALP